jgi:hypothetical protein
LQIWYARRMRETQFSQALIKELYATDLRRSSVSIGIPNRSFII